MSSTALSDTAAARRRSWGRWLLREDTAAAGVFAVLGVLPLLFSGYVIYILPQYMLYGVLAMSLALMWGFAGMLTDDWKKTRGP